MKKVSIISRLALSLALILLTGGLSAQCFNYNGEQYSDIILPKRATGSGTLVYPNPFGNALTLSTDLEAPTDYHLTDALGRILSRGFIATGAQTTTISTATLPAGRYLMRVGDKTLPVVK